MEESKVMHFVLLVIILFLFSKLSFDAVILGALAILFFQNRKRI